MNADDRHSPVRARVLDEAIAWQLLLDSGEAHPDDHRAFHRWYAALSYIFDNGVAPYI
ncbi:DUF4880 domain-containing protein, partial [Pseudomonas aeruginosa]|nr:DUF4880 domain-containing protein [Pseudomonas aeruginosa]